jgi:exodeoxyribonuclease V alpha subunit
MLPGGGWTGNWGYGAYAVTIHKSQGSESPAAVIPLATQQYMLLQRNLVYMGITRGRELVVIIGQRKMLGMEG